jgi:hypothetical protein
MDILLTDLYILTELATYVSDTDLDEIKYTTEEF